MSAGPLDDTDQQAATSAEQDDRFAELESGDGVIIYDRQNHRAWIQSPDAELVTEMQ